jgi:hypothetical protein
MTIGVSRATTTVGPARLSENARADVATIHTLASTARLKKTFTVNPLVDLVAIQHHSPSNSLWIDDDRHLVSVRKHLLLERHPPTTLNGERYNVIHIGNGDE